MAIEQFRHRIAEIYPKYKYAFLVFLLGIALMLYPSGKKDDTNETTENHREVIPEVVSLQNELENILKLMDGAGKVRVLLSESEGASIYYQTNESRTSDEKSSSVRTDTVTVTDAGRNQQGLQRQVVRPKYRGAVILCQGAQSAVVRLAVIEAVANATGLSYDKITVLKMK